MIAGLVYSLRQTLWQGAACCCLAAAIKWQLKSQLWPHDSARSVLPSVHQCALQALAPLSPLARDPPGSDAVLHVNSFDVDYRSDGSVAQFNSDISVLDLDGREQQRRTIFVNSPLRWATWTTLSRGSSAALLPALVPAAPHCCSENLHCFGFFVRVQTIVWLQVPWRDSLPD